MSAFGEVRGRSAALEGVARPGEAHGRAGLGRRAVGESHRRAGALQERLGDEVAEAEAAARLAGVAWPALGDIGLAEPADDVGREARPVVDDGDRDALLVPAG